VRKEKNLEDPQTKLSVTKGRKEGHRRRSRTSQKSRPGGLDVSNLYKVHQGRYV
jgi:hypothetical protein